VGNLIVKELHDKARGTQRTSLLHSPPASSHARAAPKLKLLLADVRDGQPAALRSPSVTCWSKSTASLCAARTQARCLCGACQYAPAPALAVLRAPTIRARAAHRQLTSRGRVAGLHLDL
jgi:hypothetical protein